MARRPYEGYVKIVTNIAIRITYGGKTLLCGSIFFITTIPIIATPHTNKEPAMLFTSFSACLMLNANNLLFLSFSI